MVDSAATQAGAGVAESTIWPAMERSGAQRWPESRSSPFRGRPVTVNGGVLVAKSGLTTRYVADLDRAVDAPAPAASPRASGARTANDANETAYVSNAS